MRSYYSHLETFNPQQKGPIEKRPVLRSSAIFPALHSEGISSRILFMGYWLLKRNISEILSIITLRSLEGKILYRHLLKITEAKAYRIELKELLKEIDFPLEQSFFGSMEIEFFSVENLVFPFPATVINFYGQDFSSVVHTAQRVYNDFEDMKNNSQTAVGESGFNIYADTDKEPFIALINGGEFVKDCKIEFIFYNQKGEILKYSKELGKANPYQTFMIYPAKEVSLREFLKGEAGACKIHFNVAWIFPRLVVGNFTKNPSGFVITHSYYDCSKAQSESDYWRFSDPDWYQESLALPLIQTEKYFTKVYFYPIYSPSNFFIDLEIFNQKGQLLGRLEKFLQVASPSDSFFSIPFSEVFKRLNLTAESPLGVRIMAHSQKGSKLPARIKVAFDYGEQGRGLPCNICTNLQPFNPALETKTKSFKWGPILADKEGASVWIMNSQPRKQYQKEDHIELTIYRERDTATLKRNVAIPPNGFTILEPEKDPELKHFLEGEIGWFTAITSNPYTTTYYFSKGDKGIIGGDHGF